MTNFKFKNTHTISVLATVLSLSVIVNTFIICGAGAFSTPENTDPYRRSEILDRKGKYLLEWHVDWIEKTVTFNVTVQTRGYIGFGLSKKGKMSGADIVIGGVHKNGKAYFTDRHAVAHQLPEEDDHQDWILNKAWENYTHTFLSFSRAFDTCDEDHDLPINDDTVTLIWAYGENDDNIQYHFENRGSFWTYLLDPDLIPTEVHAAHLTGERLTGLGNWDVWTIPINQDLEPPEDTTYLCTFYKAPHQYGKRHMIGFRTVLDTALEARHVHHFLFHRCYPPRGVDPDEFFGKYVGRPGEKCYILNARSNIPGEYCREVVHTWAVGATPIFFPDHVGMSLLAGEYYMFQVHYDNPQLIPGINLNFALEVYHTDEIRKYDAGIIFTGMATPGSPTTMIPSHSINFTVYGHCGSECTRKMYPPEGVQVFASNLHTHLAGRAASIMHIRNNRELQPMLKDDNYVFDYQPTKILRSERTILPGDTVMIKCSYDTTDRNGSATVGGFSTHSEMCNVLMYYYPYVKNANYGICSSDIRSREYREFVQVLNMTWSDDEVENVVTAPAYNARLTTREVGTRRDWTIEDRRKLQEYMRHLPHISACPDLGPDFVEQNLVTSSSIRLSDSRRYSKQYQDPYEIPDPAKNEVVSVYPDDVTPYPAEPSLCSRKY